MKNMKKICLSLLLVLTLLLTLIACASSGNGSAARPELGGDSGYQTGDSAGGSNSAVITDRKIIKTVYETVETENYDDAIEALKSKVAALGGYFVSSRYSGGANAENARKASFEIRIPAEKLADFTSEVEGLATVLSYNETANDITLSYIDTASRIEVLETKEKAFLAMAENAKTTSELLEIEKYLSDVQATLASLRAQKQNYDTLVSYSTVHLDLREVLHERATDGTFFSEVGHDFTESLSAIGFFFRSLGVFLLGSSPILILIAAIGVGCFFLVRAVLRKKKAKEEIKEEPKEEIKE